MSEREIEVSKMRTLAAELIGDALRYGKDIGYREGFLACREAAAKVAKWRVDVWKKCRDAENDDGASSAMSLMEECEDIANAIEALTPGER